MAWNIDDYSAMRSAVKAFAVHILTAAGAAAALFALMEATRDHWTAMFGWLGFALVIDGVDGTLARRFDVTKRLPRWSGDVLDLVVDFVTYVFVPAYAIAASRLLGPLVGPLIAAGVVMSGAIYFADRRMKADDNHFRGFPALWNVAAFYLFLLTPPPAVAAVGLTLLIVLTFVPLRVIHPVRVRRFRPFNLALIAAWAALALTALAQHLDPPFAVKAALCAIALYILLIDSVIRLIRRGRT